MAGWSCESWWNSCTRCCSGGWSRPGEGCHWSQWNGKDYHQYSGNQWTTTDNSMSLKWFDFHLNFCITATFWQMNTKIKHTKNGIWPLETVSVGIYTVYDFYQLMLICFYYLIWLLYLVLIFPLLLITLGKPLKPFIPCVYIFTVYIYLQAKTSDPHITLERQASATMTALPHTTKSNNYIHIGEKQPEIISDGNVSGDGLGNAA